MFKRVFGIILAVVMCLSFVSCGGEKKSGEKVYKIATDTAFPPFEIPDVNGSDKLTGIDIDVQPTGKAVQNIRLFSGGEKALIAICVIFSILKVKPVPLIIFDEVEAALDQANVERFAKYLKTFADHTQFIVVTHRPGTMEQCDVLYGVQRKSIIMGALQRRNVA